MLELPNIWLTKSEENLKAAQSEFGNWRYNSCANRAYYAAFHAAIWALSREGIRPPGQDRYWGHDFVQARFAGVLINRRKVYSTSLRSALTDLYRLREQADYETTMVVEIRAYRAVRKAKELVQAVQERSKTP